MRCGSLRAALQARVGARQCVERGGDHQLKIALGEHDVGVLPVEDFALLGDAKFAGEAVDRLSEDGAMRGSAAAADRAAAAVEEPQRHAALAATSCSARWAFQISQVLVIMPPSLLESE